MCCTLGRYYGTILVASSYWLVVVVASTIVQYLSRYLLLVLLKYMISKV